MATGFNRGSPLGSGYARWGYWSLASGETGQAILIPEFHTVSIHLSAIVNNGSSLALQVSNHVTTPVYITAKADDATETALTALNAVGFYRLKGPAALLRPVALTITSATIVVLLLADHLTDFSTV